MTENTVRPPITHIHRRIEDAGYQYKGKLGTFNHYTSDNGHTILHKYPTKMGNHSIRHIDADGHTILKSANTGDTEIARHLGLFLKSQHRVVWEAFTKDNTDVYTEEDLRILNRQLDRLGIDPDDSEAIQHASTKIARSYDTAVTKPKIVKML